MFAVAPWIQSDMARPADPNDPDFALQWGLKNAEQVVDGQAGFIGADVDAPGAWDIHMGTSSVIVAIVGRGVDPHPEFADRLLEGRAFVDDLFDTLDRCTHDTHLAGIIAAATNDGVGVAGLNGAAMLLPVRAFDGCNGSEVAVAEGITWAADQGADIILVAISFDNPDTNLETALDYATAQDVLVIASVGNAGNPTVSYPAAYGNCLAVSATTNQDTRSSFSNFGAEVDVAADMRTVGGVGEWQIVYEHGGIRSHTAHVGEPDEPGHGNVPPFRDRLGYVDVDVVVGGEVRIDRYSQQTAL
ncbi:MAG: S8 family serine peptidase [Acidobacteria bacterium]|nr:S8 family serine peptidase [Acidobacteriota bacterium]